MKKVIIAGFPMKMRGDEVFGFWSWVVEWLPWDEILVYEGSYWRALITWVRG